MAVVKDLGKKFKCFKCGCKFYDLSKPAPICPRCGEDQTNEENKKILKKKRKRGVTKIRGEMRPEMEEGMVDLELDEGFEEYVPDMDDIVLEESEPSEAESSEDEGEKE